MATHLDEQQRRNRMSRDNWSRAEPHRAIVTEMLIAARPLTPDLSSPWGARAGRARLAVLGAGNCNDLDLPRLIEEFEHVELIDLDGESLAWGVNQQGVAGDAQLTLHGGVDLSGLVEVAGGWSTSNGLGEHELDECLTRAAAVRLPLPAGSCSVAASVCLLTQMLEPIIAAVKPEHPRFIDVIGAVRRRHLQLLAELSEPGGRFVLVTDVVSSDTCPQLASIAEAQLAAFVGRQIQQRNFFTGVNPFVLRRILETDPAIASMVSDVRLSLPWRWPLGPRTYAVVALTGRRREAD
jgi:hypothetical protein